MYVYDEDEAMSRQLIIKIYISIFCNAVILFQRLKMHYFNTKKSLPLHSSYPTSIPQSHHIVFVPDLRHRGFLSVDL